MVHGETAFFMDGHGERLFFHGNDLESSNWNIHHCLQVDVYATT